MSDKAVFWICSGPQYIEEANISALSVKKHMPNLRRILFTPDEGVQSDCFHQGIQLPARIHQDWFLESTRYLEIALPQLPEYIVWATADTYCCAPFDDIFDILARFEMASTITPGRVSGNTVDPIPELFPEPAICVIGIHNIPFTQWVITDWYRNYLKHLDVYNGDQPSLRETLWDHEEIRFCTLPNEWLAVLAVPNLVRGTVKWLHGRTGNGELMEHYAQDINSKSELRIWRAGTCA